jgi:hypothetical protein
MKTWTQIVAGLVLAAGTALVHASTIGEAKAHVDVALAEVKVKDAGGKVFVMEHIAKVQAGGTTEIDLRWAHPETEQIADAVMGSKRVPGQHMYIGSVAFKYAATRPPCAV